MIVVAASLMIMLYSIKANSRTIPVISDIDFPTATAQVFIATEYIKAGSLILGVSSTPFNVPPNAAGNDGRIWTYVDEWKADIIMVAVIFVVLIGGTLLTIHMLRALS
ncbi:hypothetical protein LCGC14_2838690 [marine sediment metagenome]|uniref:Uncharacterized protein n=1 Tax=marine sediment metagenome TaxID=412755 RepID=A0A0F8YBV8_9ZZZZ